MKVVFTKDYTDDHGRKWKAGKKTSLSKDLAEKVLKEKVAKPIDPGHNFYKDLVGKAEKAGIEIK